MRPSFERDEFIQPFWRGASNSTYIVSMSAWEKKLNNRAEKHREILFP